MNLNRRNNSLKGVMIDGSWVDEPGRVKEAVRLFFLQRFEEIERVRPKLDGVRFQCIGQQQNDMLSGRFHADEIKMTVWDCGGEKSPGPDGLNFKFIKEFWQVINSELFGFWRNSMLTKFFQRDAVPPLLL